MAGRRRKHKVGARRRARRDPRAAFDWRAALFPSADAPTPSWRWLGAWLLGAFALRAAIALGGDFVLHPDEIMQYLEPAHRAVFGNGVVYWEFHYGARSWLVPGLAAAVLWSLDAVGLGQPWVYVYAVKLVLCLISLLVPWGCYQFARRALGESSARIALALTCLWPYLVVFAHKPFAEFVATSLLCGALGLASLSPRCAADGARGKVIAAAFGATLALLAAVRMQYLPMAMLLWLARIACAARTTDGRNWIALSIVGGAVVLLLVGALETLTWGAPFHSYYTNFVFNLELDRHRAAQPLHFYPARLLFATAGALLLALYAFIRRPRRHLLLLALCATTLALHMHQTHQEFRFIFALLPLLLVVIADPLSRCAARWPRAFNLKTIAAGAGALLVLVSVNAVPDGWLHTADSKERGEVRYLFGQSNLFDVYLHLARQSDVVGVLHLGDRYFNTPGYYYLHHRVPFYDDESLAYAAHQTGARNHAELASHIIARTGNLPALPGLRVLQTGGAYTSARIPDARAVHTWKHYKPLRPDQGIAHFAHQKLGAKHPARLPPQIEFTDERAQPAR